MEAELLTQELPSLRFKRCYYSTSNLCANRVCLTHTVKCFTGVLHGTELLFPWGACLICKRDVKILGFQYFLYVFPASPGPAWHEYSQWKQSLPLSSVELSLLPSLSPRRSCTHSSNALSPSASPPLARVLLAADMGWGPSNHLP